MPVARKPKRKRHPVQLELRPRTWGGKRDGAGRKPTGKRKDLPHRARLRFSKTLPVHVTVRMTRETWNLRSRRSFRIIERALSQGGADRFGVRVVQFSVQGNHIHWMVEAADHQALSRAMKGLAVRLARGLNRLMGRKGRVLADRYHAHLLRTPTEVKRARSYIRENARRHAQGWGEALPDAWVDPFSSDSRELGVSLPAAETWLIQEGWQRAP